MSKGIKFKDNTYLDSSGVSHNRVALNTILNKLIPVTLYDNSSGNNGNVTLSETSANFEFIDIFFRTNTYDYGSLRIYRPYNSSFTLNKIDNNSGTTLFAKMSKYSLSGTSITRTDARWEEIQSSAKGTDATIFILRVVGYRS